MYLFFYNTAAIAVATVTWGKWSTELNFGFRQADDDCPDPLPNLSAKATVRLPAAAHRRPSNRWSMVQRRIGNLSG